jgi:antitoxin component of MazEF toxin-antitoxin module
MTTRIVRVGNTLTVEIPEELVAQASLPVGEPVEWVPNGSGSIALVSSSKSPARKDPADMTLEELLDGIPEGAEMEKIDWGPDRGAEVW